MKRTEIHMFLLSLVILAAGCATTDDYPAVTDDGLVRLKDTQAQAVYAQPGADLGGYRRIWLEDASVQFRKNWRRDQTRTAATTTTRITDADMQRIREGLAALFNEVFTSELTRHGYELVDGAGEDVLRIRPQIMDLDVRAPDLQSPGNTKVYTESAGEMTLKLELYDSVTGDLIAMGVDRREDPRRGYVQWQTSVANKAAAERILKDWAVILREGLDEAMEKTAP